METLTIELLTDTLKLAGLVANYTQNGRPNSHKREYPRI